MHREEERRRGPMEREGVGGAVSFRRGSSDIQLPQQKQNFLKLDSVLRSVASPSRHAIVASDTCLETVND